MVQRVYFVVCSGSPRLAYWNDFGNIMKTYLMAIDDNQPLQEQSFVVRRHLDATIQHEYQVEDGGSGFLFAPLTPGGAVL